MIDNAILKSDERAILTLRSIYKQYGYMPYKMSKFEEYDFYIKNKDFLLSDRIITFNDTNGKLLALKPDVTLSIIKNADDTPGTKHKVYYNENVYRVSGSSGQYKEIMQTGVECVGDIGIYDIYETIMLAAKSLEAISENFVLDISELDILKDALSAACDDDAFKKDAIKCIKEKNAHDLEKLAVKYGVSDEAKNRLTAYASIGGRLCDVIPELEKQAGNTACAAIEELKLLSSLLGDKYSKKIMFDFSVINDMDYYSGVVFRGFIDGIPGCVLAGGRYDKLLSKMGKLGAAIGFAIYLDKIESIGKRSDYDVDILLICGDGTPPELIASTVSLYTESGKTVSVQKCIPKKLRYRELITIGGEKQ